MHLGWICTGSLSSCTDRPHPGGRGHNQGGVVVVGLKIGDNILKWGVTMRDTCHTKCSAHPSSVLLKRCTFGCTPSLGRDAEREVGARNELTIEVAMVLMQPPVTPPLACQ